MTTTRSRPYSPLLDRTLRLALEYLEQLPEGPVGAAATLAELRQRLDRPLPREGREPSAVIEQLAADAAGGLAASTGGRFFGWVISGAVPAALAADWLRPPGTRTPACMRWRRRPRWSRSVWPVAPRAAAPRPTASFALVTGCQMAHVTCLAAARNAVLARHGWDVEQQGLFGAPAIRVVTGDQRHGTIERALRLLGLGQRTVVDIPVDENGLTGPALEPVLAAAPSAPTIVLLQAGDLNTGAFDPFPEVVPVAHRYGAWAHVDGAFGL
jgi:hypothetical protein